MIVNADARLVRCSAPSGLLGSRYSFRGSRLDPRRLLLRTARKSVPRAAALQTDENQTSTVISNSKSVAAVILGGGAGTRLYPLTKSRAKPAVPIGGAYRLIDVPMSNCLNSGISKMYILTQFNSVSLNRHLARTYNFGNGIMYGGSGFVEVLAATQTPGLGGKEWFQGTADAVRQYSWLFEDVKNKDVQDVVILSGDHLYRMDYMAFVDRHREVNADITIGCLPMDGERASDFGLMKIDKTGRITEFAEKPEGNDLLAMQVDTTVLGLSPEESQASPYIASMGIYVFKKSALISFLNSEYPKDNDFGGEIIPKAAADGYHVQAYLFKDYWEDIGTIKSFFEANLALAKHPPQFEFYDARAPIYTSPRFLPPVGIGEGCTITNAIIDKNARIGKNCIITNASGIDDLEDEENGVYIRSGIVTILRNATIPDGTVI
mmetsp:Transcript_54526/g.131440  ORF Transcript_54526/g.131440 Transcript_54526/m.131440 type:complete len:435 (-) Transcript_54526:692-1996(-)